MRTVNNWDGFGGWWVSSRFILPNVNNGVERLFSVPSNALGWPEVPELGERDHQRSGAEGWGCVALPRRAPYGVLHVNFRASCG